MQVSDLLDELHKQKFVAEMNQRYHQLKQSKWSNWDKGVKIAVAILAILAVVALSFPAGWKAAEATLAILAAIVAVGLNVIPVSESATHHGEMFRSWSDLVLTAEQLELKSRRLGTDAKVAEALFERLEEIASRSLQLDAMETAPDQSLLEKCQGDINERIYGKGIRTYAQATKAQTAREAAVPHHA